MAAPGPGPGGDSAVAQRRHLAAAGAGKWRPRRGAALGEGVRVRDSEGSAGSGSGGAGNGGGVKPTGQGCLSASGVSAGLRGPASSHEERASRLRRAGQLLFYTEIDILPENLVRE